MPIKANFVMMSTKRSLQSLTLVLVVFTIFTVSLTETIQISDGNISSSTTHQVTITDKLEINDDAYIEKPVPRLTDVSYFEYDFFSLFW